MEHSRFQILFQIPKLNILQSIFIKTFLNMDIEKSAEQWKKQGNEAFKNKNYEKAIQHYSHAIKCDPKDYSFYSNRAICYYNLNMFHQCIEDCNSCINIKSNFSKAYRRKALALVQLLKFGQAIVTYKEAMAFDKDMTIRNQLEEAQSIENNYTRYFKAVENQEYTEALSCLNYVISKIDSNDNLKLFKVECMAKTGDTAGALTLLKSIPIATTQHPDTWYLKGIIELYGGDSARAKKFFMEGMRLDPDNNKCRLALNKAKSCEKLKQQGNEAIKKGDYAEAEGKYTEALNLDPFNKKLNAVIYSNRALTYMKRKDNLKALDDLNKSLELDPSYSKSLIRRAEVQMERGEYTAAIMDYNKIEELDPSANMKPKIKQAQKKERQAKKKDYYKILGIDRNADDATIKKSYKTLALKYHPDRNRTKSQAEQDEASKMFKEVAQAYGVLSDPKKKQRYDSGQMDFDGDQGDFGGFGGGGVDPNDIFRMFFGGGGMGGMGGMGGFGGMGGMGGGGSQKFTFRFG